MIFHFFLGTSIRITGWGIVKIRITFVHCLSPSNGGVFMEKVKYILRAHYSARILAKTGEGDRPLFIPKHYPYIVMFFIESLRIVRVALSSLTPPVSSLSLINFRSPTFPYPLLPPASSSSSNSLDQCCAHSLALSRYLDLSGFFGFWRWRSTYFLP